MKKIVGYQNTGTQMQSYPVSGAAASVNSLPPGILASDGTAILSAGSGPDSTLGLTTATSTTNRVIEAGTLTYVGSPTVTLANYTAGPGKMTKMHFIASAGSGYSASGMRGLIFSFYVDGETTPSIVFDGDLWGCSALGIVTPTGQAPFVWETDHLILMYSSDSAGDYNLEFIFKYHVPFSTSLKVTVQNPAQTAVFISPYWSCVDIQAGVVSPRRLKSQYTSCLSPAAWSSVTAYSAGTFVTYTDGYIYNCILSAQGSGQAPGNTTYWTKIGLATQLMPSAVQWVSNYTSGGGYIVGNMCTDLGALYLCISPVSGSTTHPASDPTHWSATTTAANPNLSTGFPLLSVNQPCWLAHFGFGSQGIVAGGANSVGFLESNLAVYDGNLSPGDSYPGNSPTPMYNSTGTEDFMGASFYWQSLGSPENPSYESPATEVTITSISGDGTNMTITVSPAMSTALGAIPAPPFNSYITVSGNSNSAYNGTFQVKGGNNTTTIICANTTSGSGSGGVVGLPAVIRLTGKNGSLKHAMFIAANSAFVCAANVDLISLTSGGIKCGTSCLFRWEQGGNASGTGPINANTTWKINPTILYYV